MFIFIWNIFGGIEAVFIYLNDGIGYAWTKQNNANVWLDSRSIHDRFKSLDCKAGGLAIIGSVFKTKLFQTKHNSSFFFS